MDSRYRDIPHVEPEFIRRALEKITFACRFAVSREVLRSFTMEQVLDVTVPHMVFEVTATLAGDRIDGPIVQRDSETIETPATWWDHWKQSHMDSPLIGWYVRRHPPNMIRHTLCTTIELARYYMYPQAPVSLLGPAWPHIMVTKHERHIRNEG